MTNIIVMSNSKRKTIKDFMTQFVKDSGEDVMPDYLQARWYGVDNRFYQKVWEKLDGDNDPYLFDDFCDISFDVRMGNEESLNSLSGERLNKLYVYSKEMLGHYKIVSFLWNFLGLFIKHVFSPFFHKIFIPVYIFFRYFWIIWVIFVDSLVDFAKEFGKFLIGKN